MDQYTKTDDILKDMCGLEKAMTTADLYHIITPPILQFPYMYGIIKAYAGGVRT